MPWDSLSPNHRRVRAKEMDSNNDPALEGERDRTWELAVELIELEAELEPKIRRLAELKKKKN